MFENEIKPRMQGANLTDYKDACRNFSWDEVNRDFSWHTTGRVNIAHEAIDRQAENPSLADTNCLIYSHDKVTVQITFRQMRLLSNRFGNALRSLGVAKGDRVFIFLPSCPELFIALVGCAKIGAVIAPLYSNYRETAVRDRMLDGQGKVLITTTRHRTRVPEDELPDLEKCIIVGEEAGLQPDDVSWEALMTEAPDDLELEWVDPRDPLFLIYTSAPDGSPLGLLNSHDTMRGYYITAKWVLDLKEGDVLWTQALPGWPMNVAYSAFAPWLCGVTSFVTMRLSSAEEIYERFEKFGVTVFYAIARLYRMMVEAGEKTAAKYDLSRIRHMLSVIEPLTPDIIYGVMRILGLPVYDTWWTAETGMITIANFRCLPIKPGYLGRPVPGIQAAIFDKEHEEVVPFTMGELALKAPWPSMATGVWRKPEAYRQYFRQQPWLMSGDTAFADHDGYFFYQGRTGNVIITASGKLGLVEVEETVKRHPAVADAGIIRVPENHGIKQLKAYIQLKEAYSPSPQLEQKIMAYVRNNLSPDATPRSIQFCEKLPRSSKGELLHRVLKAWELGLPTGDIDKL